MKKALCGFVLVMILFACGCEKQENQAENSKSSQDYVTLVCSKTIEEDDQKETETYEIVSKDNLIKKVTVTSVSEMDSETIDFTISFSELLTKAFNEVDGIDMTFSKEGDNTLKSVMSIDYEKINMEQAEEKLGDLFDAEEFLSEKDLSVDDFKAQNLEGYECN